MGIRGLGCTREDAFAQAALALTAVITDLKTIEPKRSIEITCQAGDDGELLLASWLNALLFEMAARNMLFSRFEISIHNNRLRAAAWGEKLNIAKHKPVVEVKAATYADLKVRQKKDGTWLAQCIVDV